ncbi:MAG TPA: hypothetical protein VGQ10_05600 [Vicinamibacterales bacterium]|jgi:hypothetical protein|nr:hypothetical protein [Vicinamibacterales bacterium]
MAVLGHASRSAAGLRALSVIMGIYLTNAYGPPVLGSLLALAIGGSGMPLSLSK